MKQLKIIKKILVISLITMAGCSNNFEISGEVSVEKDGQLTTLAKTEIKAIGEENFISYIKLKLADSSKNQNEIKNQIDSKKKIIEYVDNLSINIVSAESSIISAQQNAIKARPDTQKMTALQTLRGMPGVAEIEAEMKNKAVDAQNYLLKKKISLMANLLAAEIGRQIVENNHDNYKNLQTSSDNIKSKQFIVDKIHSGNFSEKQLIDWALLYGRNVKQNALNNSDASKELNEKIKVKFDNEINELEIALSGIISGKNGSFYYPHNDSIEINQKIYSDTNGNYNLEVRSDKRFALVARRDGYYWFLWIDPKNKTIVNLSNSNMLQSDCESCIFNQHAKPSSL